MLRGSLADAQIIREVRAAARRGTVTRYRGEPAKGHHQEVLGRHLDARRGHVQRLQDVPDEPHIVVRGQPPDDHALLGVRERALDHALVVQQVTVRERDALGRSGRARCVLQERQGLGRHARRSKTVFHPVRDLVDGHPVQVIELREFRVLTGLPHGREERVGGQDEDRTAVSHDGEHAGQPPFPLRQRDRHGHQPGVKTAEKRGDELETWRQKDERAITYPRAGL